MRTTAILNGHVIDPASGLDETTNIYIRGKRILHVGNDAPTGFLAKQTIDAQGQWVFPGIIDLSVYLRDPGQEHKATIKSEALAAVRSGITTMVCMPEPETPIDNMPMVNLIRKKNKAQGKNRIEVIGATTQQLQGEKLTNMGGLKHACCVGISNQRQPFRDIRTLRLAMEYASTFDFTLFLQPIEHSLTPPGGVHEGAVATRMGLPGIPVAAETTAIATILALAEELDVRVHICRLSTANGVDMIRLAKAKGLAVTTDVAAHQLFLTDMDISDFNPLCHVQPPFRSPRDRDALRQAVTDGTIDAICSDHQPHEIDAKLAPFQQTQPGISALETLLPLTMRLVEEGILRRDQAISLLSGNPATIIDSKQGAITAGCGADLVIYDPQAMREITSESWLSQGKNTPFEGWSFAGDVTRTLVRGKTEYQHAQ